MTNLVRYPSGRYVYRRVVPAALRASIGKREIKISLRTADVEEAKRRCPDIQREVDALLEEHRRRANPVVAANEPDPPPKLTIAQIEAIARSWRERALEEFKLHRFRFKTAEERERIAAGRRWHAHEMRRQATAGEFEDRIKRGVEKLLAETGNSAVVEGAPEFSTLCQALLLARADLWEADAAWILGDHTFYPTGGLLLPDHHLARTEPPPLVAAPAPGRPGTQASNRNDTLTEAFEAWLREKPDMAKKTVHECRMVVRRLGEVVGGDPPMWSITPIHVRTLQQSLLQMPRAMPRKTQSLPILEIVERYKDRNDVQRIMPETVRKHIGLLQSFCDWAKRMRYLDENIAAGMKPKKSKRGTRKRLPFDVEDLKKIFASTIYTGCASARAHGRLRPGALLIDDEYFWLPLLALFTGGRIEELGTLLVSEVKTEEGILYLDLDVIEQNESESDDDENAVHADTAMKSYASLRPVPIHPVLLQCGFAEYVAAMRRRGQTRLFPNLKPDVDGKLTSKLSKWFGRLLDRLGIKDRRKVFHSFRHTFKSACRRAQLLEEHHDALTGHSNRSVGRQYGDGVPMVVLAEAMGKISYPGLDLAHLVRKVEAEGKAA